MLENIHEWCAEAVNLSGNCPEVTVGAWGVSAFLMLLQVFFLVKRLFSRKPEPEVVEVNTPVTVPHVPSETILKLLKLMKGQESGWHITSSQSGYATHLNYGNLTINKHSDNTITVDHKGTRVDLNKKSDNPELDQVLLREALVSRVRTERQRIKARNEIMAKNAEELANRELASVLETI